MRLTYYRLPENTIVDEADSDCFDRDDDTINCSISFAKKMLKKYGGCAWTEHIDRDGSLFEVSEVKLSGNNSHFTYNHHL